MLEADDCVVSVSDDDKVTGRALLAPRVNPEVVYVVKIDVRQQWRDGRALWRPFQRIQPLALFQHPRLQPFLDQANDPLVAYSVLESGRIEARTELRMMPTFPRSPLSFRTAGFPQYGWKAGLSGGAFPVVRGLSLLPAYTY